MARSDEIGSTIPPVVSNTFIRLPAIPFGEDLHGRAGYVRKTKHTCYQYRIKRNTHKNSQQIMLHPIAQITCQMIKLYIGLKVSPSVITATSINTSQIPRLIKNMLASLRLLLFDDR
jgi:hypothetical protein